MSKRAIAILFTTLLGVAGAAFAQLPTDEQRAACQADYIKFCSDTLPGGGRIVACLMRNYAQLTDTCKKVLDAARND
ncbi:cysteine rich repeat-containing protein [Bradyrhizobium ontarionense]|uniref:Cysteine rich repeat-containing protein n=1 Tax=Bradyrhizobium ontarionense TaxID=2898149 RepID=A0ABY3RDD8_9BRAD|nr:cysteine rich repeat-containing protein [Bradyrhizobium sp. A19]UFZ05254.1 cysteine rich repeat-containing protein [Bradyrhizobium sp. A19]